MDVFEAVVIRINDVPMENSGFSQKEIIVTPMSTDREIGTEFVAIPPTSFPTDAYGTGMLSLPQIAQRCLVVQTQGYRRVQILSYMPFSTTSSFGEYTPSDVTSGGAAFKIGGANPMTMFMHKGGKWELYSNEFCKLSLDGKKKQLHWTTDSEERIFAGGRVINTLEEIDGITNLTQHVEVYTQGFEWKQNSDLKIAGEKSILNPQSGLYPKPDYTYIPKVFIRAGIILNEFNSDLGKILGHVYDIETRQATQSGDKDTVTRLKLGRQSEMYKFDNSKLYPAGDLFEWTGKVAKMATSSRVSTHLLRFGKLDSDVLQNTTILEPTVGEIYRQQSYIDMYDAGGAANIDNLAEGKGYELDFNRKGASEQYLVSYGRLTSQKLVGSSNFTYKSAVREHFHAYDNHTAAKIGTPSGISYDFVIFGEDNTRKNIFLRKFSRISQNNEIFFHNEQFTETDYKFEVKSNDTSKWSALEFLDAQKYQNFVLISEDIELKSEIKSNSFIQYTKIANNKQKSEVLNGSSYEMKVKIDSSEYIVHFSSNSVSIKLNTGTSTKSPSITLSEGKIAITPGSAGEIIEIGEGPGLQQLVTRKWVEMVFAKHIHPTTSPGAPTLLPTPPIDFESTANSPANLYTYKLKGE